MNFTAQGYAKLNHKLNPDIAVLEGGYSIEGALPYINLGIILAMAGLDYSKVREPDYNKEKLRQPKDITEYVKKVCELTHSQWKNRKDLYIKNIRGKDYIQRQRQVYYDTDGILEDQVQNFKVCNKCPGVNTIDSKSDTGYHIFAITIPRDACPNCIDEGYRFYKHALKKYSHVYLQDRTSDEYFAK